MHDTDPVIAAILGGAVTPERIDAARRHLVMLCSLADEVRDMVPLLVPPNSGSWRSEAAGRYVDGLDELRAHLFCARDRLTDAVYSLEERIRSMQAQLDAQAPVSAGGR